MAARRDSAVAVTCLAAAFAMGGMAYAAVPLYRMFCQVTGFAGTTQKAEKASDHVLERTVTVRFDSNVAPGLSWRFEPVETTRVVHIGENVLAFFRATNTSDQPLTGTATFNVAPDTAGPFFAKVECFCFKEQTLAPGESVEMPVSFFVDPSMVSDPAGYRINEITLSYTFYKTEGRQAGKTGTAPKPGEDG